MLQHTTLDKIMKDNFNKFCN